MPLAAKMTEPSGHTITLCLISLAVEPGQPLCPGVSAEQLCAYTDLCGTDSKHQAKPIYPFQWVQSNSFLSISSCTPSRCDVCNATGSTPHHASIVRHLVAVKALFLLGDSSSCLACYIASTCRPYILSEHRMRSLSTV